MKSKLEAAGNESENIAFGHWKIGIYLSGAACWVSGIVLLALGL